MPLRAIYERVLSVVRFPPTTLVVFASIVLLFSCSPTSNHNLLSSPSGGMGLAITFPSAGQLPDAVDGRSYRMAFSASGGSGSLTWSNPGGALGSGACSGLSLSADGVISGMPDTPSGVCGFTVQVRDSRNDWTTANYSVTIQSKLVLSNFTLGNGVQNRLFKQAIIISGGIMPLTFCNASPSLPAGLSISPSGPTCLISGTPQVTFGPAVIDISVADSSNAATPAGNASGSSSLQINIPLAVSLPPRIVNGLVGFVYPGVTFTAKGGTGDGSNVTWTQAGATSESGLCVPTGTIPPGLSLAGTSGLLSGVTTMPSASVGDFQFQVCVEDAPTASTAAASSNSASVVLYVLGRYAYVSSPSQSIVIIDTASNAFVNSVTLSPSSSPQGIAVTPDGRFVFAVDNSTNQVIVLDTVTNIQVPGSPFALPASCAAPWDVAIPSDPTLPGANHVFVSCSGADDVTSFEEVVALDAANPGGAPVAVMRTGLGSIPSGIAVRSDNSRIYVTLNGTNQVFLIDNTLTMPAPIGAATFYLDPTTDQPLGIGLAANGSREYAYVTKQNTGNQDPSNPASEGIEVVDVTTDSPSTVVTVLLAPDIDFAPSGVAVDPSGKTVFVTLAGSGQLALLDNSISTPTLMAGSPFNLPNPNGSAKGVAYDVSFPPVPAGMPTAYIPFYYPFGIALLSDTIPPAALPDSPILLPPVFPYKIRPIPIPR